MSQYLNITYQLVCDALNDLAQAQSSGKLPKNPLSETHYLAAWITNAIKQKRYHNSVSDTLKIWQRRARSLGKNAGLVDIFSSLQKNYEFISDQNKGLRPVTKQQLTALCDGLTAQDWMVTTDLIVAERLNRHSDGKDSIIICATQLDALFTDDVLTKPISLYIRGNSQLAIEAALQQHLILYKITDYKSKVKYHGEYLIYPDNNGEFLPELVKI